MAINHENVGAAATVVPVTMLDIGAGDGDVCIPAYRKGTRYIYAIEPRAETDLRKNFNVQSAENQTWRLNTRVVWNGAKERILHGYHTVSSWDDGTGGKMRRVSAMSVYEVFSDVFTDLEKLGLGDYGIEYLKVDVEGAEFNILERTQQFKNLIESAKVKWIDLEIHANTSITPEQYPTYTECPEPPVCEIEAMQKPHGVEMLALIAEMGFVEDPELGKLHAYEDFKRRIFTRV